MAELFEDLMSGEETFVFPFSYMGIYIAIDYLKENFMREISGGKCG